MEWTEYIESLHPIRAIIVPDASSPERAALPLNEMTPEAEEELSNGAGDDDEQ